MRVHHALARRPARPATERWRTAAGHGRAARMARPSSRSPLAGGFLIAVGVTVGVIAGIALRQPTQGFLVGLSSGIAMAVAVWLIDRRR